MNKSEESIKKNIEDILNWDTRVDNSKIDFEIEDGRVSLKGKVPSLHMKKIIKEDIKKIAGVSEIKNDVMVEYVTGAKIKKTILDKELKNNVKIALELNPSLDAININVEVINRFVKLRGSVDSYWKKEIAEKVTSEVKGVADVINEITIIPTEDNIDEMIAKNIINILERFYNVNPDNLDIIVKDGIVSVKGTVNDWEAYDLTMKVIKYTSGVKDIEDDLIIKSF
jgi:osmotically-inducible protein OsmY